MIRVCLELLNMNSTLEIISHDNAKHLSKEVIRKYNPSHVLAIERPGRAFDGNCYSMRGEVLTDLVPNSDLLFIEAKKKNITTIAIGDGGNEMGMNKVRREVVKNVNNGDKICSVTSADCLIVAGVSNWGGYAISAALSLLSNRMLLHESPLERDLLKKIVSVGAVDGCTKESTYTVDGLSLEENLNVFNQIKKIAIV
jgi:hypothetical protein